MQVLICACKDLVVSFR